MDVPRAAQYVEPEPRRRRWITLVVALVAAGLLLAAAVVVASPDRAESAIETPSGRKAVVWHRVPTAQPVAFITVDDGYYTDQQAAEYVEQNQLPVTMFLSAWAPAVAQQPAYFKRLGLYGHTPQSHGSSHTDMRGKTYTEQKTALCGASDTLLRFYGARPTLFRPPYGYYDENTLMAARDCGHRVVVKWTHFVEPDGQLKTSFGPPRKLMPGDVVLLHFEQSPAFLTELKTAVQKISEAGLTPAYLTEYVYDNPCVM